MKNILLSFIGSSALFLTSLQAQPTPTPSAAPTTSIPQPPSPFLSGAYRPSTRSTFIPPEKGRNPFWPIGFVPRAKTAVAEEQVLRIPVEQYKLTTVILDNPSIAVINGKDYIPGQFLTFSTPTGTAKLLITKIEDGAVTVQYKALVGKITISRK
jgi:hypothetical protein